MRKKIYMFFMFAVIGLISAAEEIYNIDNVEIMGSKILNDKKTKKKIIETAKNFKGKKSRTEIFNEVESLKKYIFERGYIVSDILIGDREIVKDGKLRLVFIDGKIEEIITVKNEKIKKVPGNVFPVNKNEAVKAGDLEKGLKNYNLLSSNSGIIGVDTSENIGESVIKIINEEDKKSYGGSFNYAYTKDHKNSHVNSVSLSLYKENLLNFNERITLSYSDQPSEETRDYKFNNLDNTQYNRTVSLGVTVPVKNWVYKLNNEYNEYKQTLKGINSDYKAKGKILTQEFLLGKNITENKNHGLDYEFGLKRKDIRNYVNDQKIYTNSRIISSISNSLEYTGNNSRLRVTYEKGLKILGAENDYDSGYINNEFYPKAQYDLIQMEGNYSTFLGKKIITEISGEGSYSFDSLYENVKFTAPLTVREIKGDDGMYAGVSLLYNIGKIKKMGFLGSLKSENAFVKDKGYGGVEVYGFSAGLTGSVGNLYMSLIYGKTYASNSTEYKNKEAYKFNLGMSF